MFDDGAAQNLFCKTQGSRTYIGSVWPGRTAFPDFVKKDTREWWGRLNAQHVQSGLSGIWNDMNEPATAGCDCLDMRFDRDGRNHPHEQYHNQYGMLMAMGTVEGLLSARPNERTFVLSRAGFSGIQRYAANWMGDNMSRWEHLAMSIPMGMGMGISGQPFVGADCGGFAEAAGGELLARWTQCAALTPFFRNHNCDPKDQYPWAFGPAVERICRDAIRLRYRLLPYIYTSFMESAETGVPVQRPLVYGFQDDPGAACVSDQFMLGGALMVAPVCQAGQVARAVYLPDATWVDWYTGKTYGGGWVSMDAPPDRIPLLVRGGAVVPMLTHVPDSTMKLRPQVLDLIIAVPADGESLTSALHEDDGLTFAFQRGAYRRTTFNVTRAGDRLTIKATVAGDGFPEFRRNKFRLLFRGAKVVSAKCAGKALVVKAGAFELRNDGKGFQVDAKLG